MTLIEISEKIRDHLTKQKAVSRQPSGCAYRGADGSMCAVGCLINDDRYTSDLEHRSVPHGPVIKAIESSLGIEINYGCVRMLEMWQKYHDQLSYYRWVAHNDGDPVPNYKLESPTDFHNSLLVDIDNGIYA